MTDSYYELIDSTDALGEKFRATDLVIGTWTSSMQHAAPVSALLARALERHAQREDTRLSRVVVDLLGPVPVAGDLWVRANVARAGKQIELVTAELLALGPDGQPRPAARASGWRLQRSDTTDVVHAAVAPLGPLSQARHDDMAQRFDRNYTHSLDWRWLSPKGESSPGEAWIRPTVDLVQGEAITPIQRLFAVADDANGVGSVLRIDEWTFLNTDLVVHLYRIPEGEWIGIRAEANYGPDGIGTTVGTLFDEVGAIGAIQQSLLLRKRS